MSSKEHPSKTNDLEVDVQKENPIPERENVVSGRQKTSNSTEVSTAVSKGVNPIRKRVKMDENTNPNGAGCLTLEEEMIDQADACEGTFIIKTEKIVSYELDMSEKANMSEETNISEATDGRDQVEADTGSKYGNRKISNMESSDKILRHIKVPRQSRLSPQNWQQISNKGQLNLLKRNVCLITCAEC